MKKTTKIWLIIATLLVVLGSITFLAVMSVLNWDFVKLNTRNYVTNTYSVEDEFDNISVNLDITDVVFELAEDGKCKVECLEEENYKHNVYVKDNTLFVDANEERKWYDFIGINIGSQKITVYLTKSEYDNLLIKVSTGDIKLNKDIEFESVDMSSSTGSISVEGVSVGTLKLKASTGKINVSNVNCKGDANIKVSTGKTKLTNFECKNLISSGSTGSIILNNVIADEAISIERDTGEINIEASDAENIYLETDTGDIEGSILTDKIFVAESDLGDIDVPKTTEGGKCEIITDTGDINISIK